jgi:hypothetical protein
MQQIQGFVFAVLAGLLKSRAQSCYGVQITKKSLTPAFSKGEGDKKMSLKSSPLERI